MGDDKDQIPDEKLEEVSGGAVTQDCHHTAIQVGGHGPEEDCHHTA